MRIKFLLLENYSIRACFTNENFRRSANGKCESCEQPATFNGSDRLPFLKVHHVRQLADNGSGTVTNAVALCPNCRRELHYDENSKVLITRLYERIARLVREFV